MKYCHCCGLPEQTKTFNIFTPLGNIRHLGISTKLMFIAYEHAIALFFLFFFVFCLYAIISNVKSCDYDINNLNNPAFQKSVLFQKIISSWVYNVSLHANISCMTSTKAYEIQCWLGVVFVILFIFTFSALKYRKFKTTLNILSKN